MFEIVWDKKKVEQKILESDGDTHFLDFLAPVDIFINGEKITHPDERDTKVSSQFWDLSLNWLFILKFIDPENLGNVEFSFSPSYDNEVSGWDFEFYVDYSKEADIMTLRYKDHSLTDYRLIDIPVKEYVEGVLKANVEMIEFIGKVAPGRDDFGVVQSLKDGTEIIRKWYLERYGEDALLELR